MTNVHTFPPPSDLWKAKLHVGKAGLPKPLLVNAALALRTAPAWKDVLAFDDFAKRTMLLRHPPWEDQDLDYFERPWTAQDDLQATQWLQQQGIDVSLGIAEHAVELVAKETLYHPVLEYLDRLKWDDVKRVDNWMWVHLGVANDPYTRAVARCVLIGAIARIRDPGCKVDNAPIFEGMQGIGKSSMAETMFSTPWFTDEIADLGSKDASMQTADVWAVEVAELDAMSRGEVSKIKSFISRKTDRFRPPYGRRVVEYPRQNVFWGTTNSTGYLKDETGGRRFWPIKCGKLDIKGLEMARDQLWAEADQMYRSRVPWWIVDKDILKLAETEQAERYQGDPWDDEVSMYVITCNKNVSVAEVLTEAVNVPTERQGQAEQNRVVRILQHLGLEKYRARSSTKLSWRYRQKYVGHFPPTEPVELCESERLLAKKARLFLRAAMDIKEGRFWMN
jgi:predicted P-loop ATPase